MNIVVFGLGYSGMATSLRLCELGHTVYGYDTDEEKIKRLFQGKTGMREPGFDKLLNRYLGTQFNPVLNDPTTWFSTLLPDDHPEFDMSFICVGTQSTGSKLDDSAIKNALGFIRNMLNNNGPVVVRSTMDLCAWQSLMTLSNRMRDSIFVLPEFFQEGKALEEARNPTRLVLGMNSSVIPTALLDVLGQLRNGAPLLTMSPQSAILAKLAANTFLAQRVALINEIAAVAETESANIDDIALAVGLDPRIGPDYMKAGPGYGGGCLPKDVMALSTAGVDLANDVEKSNINHIYYVASRIRDMLYGKKSRITIWGASFKEGTSDFRGSPASEVMDYLTDSLAIEQIKIYQPDLDRAEVIKQYFEDSVICSNLYESLEGADLLIVLTREPEFRDFDFNQAVLAMRTHQIYDAVRFLPARQLLDMKFEYHALGIDQNQLKNL